VNKHPVTRFPSVHSKICPNDCSLLLPALWHSKVFRTETAENKPFFIPFQKEVRAKAKNTFKAK
jgi:hypothetical protein